jgi:hypothetical protein
VELTVAAEVFMNNPGYFSMSARERSDAEALILFLREKLVADDPTITGFNIGVNCGESAGYCVYLPKRDHGDDQILSIQARMEKDFARDFDMDLVARNNGISRRTFERRFKSATGDTPLVYLQRIRVVPGPAKGSHAWSRIRRKSGLVEPQGEGKDVGSAPFYLDLTSPLPCQDQTIEAMTGVIAPVRPF